VGDRTEQCGVPFALLFNLGARWRWVVSLTQRPPYSRRKSLMNRRFVRAQNQRGHSEEENNFLSPPGSGNKIVQSVAWLNIYKDGESKASWKCKNTVAAKILFFFKLRSRDPPTLLTYCMVQIPSWAANCLQLVKKFPAFHGTRRFITALTSVRHLSLSWASPIQSTCPHPTSWRSILILSTHLRLGLPSVLFPSGFHTKTLYTPSPPNFKFRAVRCTRNTPIIVFDK
jgi:hypothetical protein